MTPEGALEFVREFKKTLPDGWGFLLVDDGSAGGSMLVVTETSPPLPGGWFVWISKRLLGGEVLRGGVLFTEKDEPQDVEARAWAVLGLLQQRERIEAARWN
ncbi:MAG TPA: hypothetical protein VI589_06960 [Vicinamibacteria bacterium]